VDIFNVDVPEPLEASVMLAGVNVIVGSWVTVGDIVADRVTVPEKPFKLVSETLEEPELPREIESIVGLVATLKSVTFSLKLNV